MRLRQSYLRITKRAAMMAGRYAHAKQFNRHHRELRFLRTRLSRIIRDIRRKIADQTEVEVAFEWPLSRAAQIRSQQQRQRRWKTHRQPPAISRGYPFVALLNYALAT